MSTAERIILGIDAALANATATVSDEEVAGQAAAELLIPLASKGWLVDISSGGPVSVVLDAGSPQIMQSIWTSGARCTGFGPETLEVKVETADDAAITVNALTWHDGEYRTESAEGAVPYNGLEQPNVGPTDAQLAEIMLQGRFHRLDRLAEGAEVTRQFVRHTFTHTATPAAGQFLFVPWISAGWGFELDFNPSSGQASFGQVYEPGSGRPLKRWEIDLDYFQERDLWTRLHRNFIDNSTKELRLWIVREPADLANFYEKSGVFWARFDATTESSGIVSTTEARVNKTRMLAVERFGVEKVQ